VGIVKANSTSYNTDAIVSKCRTR